jgi:hypothetical protein
MNDGGFIMFSSPMMIAMFIIGVFILLLFVSGIGIAIYQIARGRLFIDYDRMAAEAWKNYKENKS